MKTQSPSKPNLLRSTLFFGSLGVLLSSACLVSKAADSDVWLESVLELDLLDYKELILGDDETRKRTMGFNPRASMAYHAGDVYFAYQHDIYSVPFSFGDNESAARIDIPRPELTFYTRLHRVHDPGVRDELILLILDMQKLKSDPEDAAKTFFWIRDGGERLEPAGDQFVRYLDNPGGYTNLRMSKVFAARGKVFANIGLGPHELWVASDWEGPWEGLISDHWGHSGQTGAQFFIDPDDGLVVTGGLGWHADLGRGVLADNFMEWQEEFRWLERDEIEFPSAAENLPDFRAFQRFARNALTKTVFAGGGGWILRSTDAAQSFEAVLYPPYSAEPRGEARGPSVGLDPDDPSHFPYFRAIAFPTEHAHFMLVGGHEPYFTHQLYTEHHARAEVYFSWDDGLTWTRITEQLPKSDAILSPILFLENMPDGHLYLGRLQFRTPPDPEEDPFRPFDPYLAIYRVHLPDPAAAFRGMTLRPEGWRHGDAFGELYTAWYPWTWNPEQGVWTFVSDAPEGFWSWDPDLGWLWSSETVYPYLYSATRDGYLFYMRGTSAPRSFYDFVEDEWITDS